MANGKPETPGSSKQTAVAVGAGAALGAIVLAPVAIAAAPILLPAAAASMIIGSSAVGGAVLGGIAGWFVGGKE